MPDEQFAEALRQIKSIVDKALAGKPLPRTAKTFEAPQSPNRRKSLPDHILDLRESGFFTQPKTYNEVHTKLQSTYSCDLERVRVACLRLQKRKELRKTSKLLGANSQVAYVW
jgi:hypothetical protein